MAKRFLDNEAKEAREDDSDSEIGYQRKRAKTLEYDEPSSDESVTEDEEGLDWTSDDADFIDDRPASALTIYSIDLPDKSNELIRVQTKHLLVEEYEIILKFELQQKTE